MNDLLGKHTLLAVLTLPHELFYPAAAKQVVAIFVQKGKPHPKNQAVFWGRVVRDGHLKLKSKRLAAGDMIPPREELDELPIILPVLQNFINRPNTVNANEPMFYKTAPIDFDDPLLELLPEAYLDSKPVSKDEIERAVDDLMRETVTVLIRLKKEPLVESINGKD